ncbi:MAG: recombinase family protein [Candidatus Aminicenantes bacterium]|nr:recombinase family protein [Candidatus Aminicenantes bacterium]
MIRYIIYCRKSSEAEDRQVLSIESQISELKKLAEKLNLSVVDIFTESQSAKSPGRPLFNEMIKKINQGKAEGIICWKLDRLARNPIDGGQIIWMLQKAIIKHIQTFDRGYYPEDNVLLMSVEFGMANQYVLDLSKNVKRGLKTKAERGWYPAPAPLGYLNDKTKERGKREIVKDPERFELVKKMWEMMLTGNYTPPKIAAIANNEWGFITPKGKPLLRSTIYRLFTNPFYYGWFEYPVRSGNWYKGSHEPMITQEEFDRVQILLGRKGKPRIKKHNFAFTGLIRCGECGAMITAEEKNQIICSSCKFKFSSNNRAECPKCKTSIEKMKSPTILHYVYYHCTKRIKPDCTQRSIEVKELEKQIDQYLTNIHISEEFKNWAIKYLKEENEKEVSSRENIFASQRKAYDSCLKKLENLFQLKISPLNSDGSLLSDEEYAKQKTELMKEKARLEEILNDTEGRVEKWLETGEKIFNFARYARYWFKNGSSQEKAQILQALGSNLTLKNKKLLIELKTPFRAIGQVVKEVPEAKYRFEPKKSVLNEAKLREIYLQNPIVLRAMNKVRTWIRQNLENFYFPSFS